MLKRHNLATVLSSSRCRCGSFPPSKFEDPMFNPSSEFQMRPSDRAPGPPSNRPLRYWPVIAARQPACWNGSFTGQALQRTVRAELKDATSTGGCLEATSTSIGVNSIALWLQWLPPRNLFLMSKIASTDQGRRGLKWAHYQASRGHGCYRPKTARGGALRGSNVLSTHNNVQSSLPFPAPCSSHCCTA
jgi:hypothetical protein